MLTTKRVIIPISDLSGGLNTTDPDTQVGDRFLGRGRNQVIGCLDLMLHTKKQRPGSKGASGVHSGYCRGLGYYLQHDGTEHILSVSGGKLYRHTVLDPPFTASELFDMTGDGEAWFQDYLDICVVCNGTNVVKVEGTDAYQLGIDAPSGASSALLAATGSLSDGTWKVIVCYARDVGGSTVLYSTGQALNDVVIASPDSAIRITMANSPDGQVNNKVVFLSGPSDGGIYYKYHETGDNTTTQIDVTTEANKNTIIYSVEAQRNASVPAFEYILVHNNYLYGTVGNTLYRSLRAGTRYDLERFDTRSAGGNTADYPYDIQGIWSIGDDVYLNTPHAMIRIPQGEINAEFEEIPGYFKYPRTVRPWNGGLIGLTAHGVMFFDGSKFYPHDIAQDIKPQIQALYDGYSDNFRPCAAIYRRSDRLEYHLVYRDSQVSTTHNNRRLVLNLDKVAFMQEARVAAPWEVWSNGAAYMVVTDNNVWYCIQSLSGDCVMYEEDPALKRDQFIYKKGVLESADKYGFEIQLGRFRPNIAGLTRWIQAFLHAKYNPTVTIRVDAALWPANAAYSAQANTVASGLPLFGVARFGIDRFAPEGPIYKRLKLSRALKSKGMLVTISQDDEDPVFQLLDAEIHGVLAVGRFT